MKRFYKAVSTNPTEGGWGVLLDDRPVLTPKRNALILPTQSLAEAIAAEWMIQDEDINLEDLILTRKARAVIDLVRNDREGYVNGCLKYGESDLVCYRADWPAGLIVRQSESWDPIVDWAQKNYDVAIIVMSGVMYRPQPEDSLKVFKNAMERLNDWELLALHSFVSTCGSLLIGLACFEGQLSIAKAVEAAELDIQWQLEDWGSDPEALKAHEDRIEAIETDWRFLNLTRRDD